MEHEGMFVVRHALYLYSFRSVVAFEVALYGVLIDDL